MKKFFSWPKWFTMGAEGDLRKMIPAFVLLAFLVGIVMNMVFTMFFEGLNPWEAYQVFTDQELLTQLKNIGIAVIVTFFAVLGIGAFWIHFPQWAARRDSRTQTERNERMMNKLTGTRREMVLLEGQVATLRRELAEQKELVEKYEKMQVELLGVMADAIIKIEKVPHRRGDAPIAWAKLEMNRVLGEVMGEPARAIILEGAYRAIHGHGYHDKEPEKGES